MLKLTLRSDRPRRVIGLIGTLLLSLTLFGQDSTVDLDAIHSALIPKREVGADVFIAENPTYDGRDVIIAVFDTGVDPAAAGLRVTTTGKRKVIDIIDGSGSGDVNTSKIVERNEDGTLAGLTGLTLTLPENVQNSTSEFRVGMKPAEELFPSGALARLKAQVKAEWAAELALIGHENERADNNELEAAEKTAAADRTLEQRNLIALNSAREALEAGYASAGPGLVYDCVVWHDGTDWRVIVDANRNGDLSDDVVLRPYGVAGEYGTFDPYTNATYGVQVYEEGDLLSIVTTAGSHGSHVASISAAHDPENANRNGVAPGAQILSVKIGDSRVGSSSYGTGERRAVAMAAKYGVDLTNVSYGGASTYQDGTDHFSTNFKEMVRRYDILTIMSAGNEGPALSTAGTAGGEADFILGVGAHSSAEMSKVLYNAIEVSPDAALQFTSRGPTKDGDIGVDIMGPGAAWASYSAETISATSMNNGTSMSSPSVAGVAALVISAAKQNGMNPRPALMRNALMLGATPIPAEEIFTRGAGMANAGGAWAKLQELASETAFDVFWDRDVDGGTFVDHGRGLYIREPVDELRRQFQASVSPVWPESTSTDDRYRFEADFTLKATDSWIDAPDYMHMANGSERLTVQMNLPDMDDQGRMRGSLITSRVDAFVAGKENLGPVFNIPITVVRPADPSVFEEGIHKTEIALNPAVTVRRFYQVPAGIEKLHIRVKHVAEDPVARRFFLQVLTLASQSPQSRYKTDTVAWFEEGEERLIEVNVRAGSVTELAFNQYFYSAESSNLELELEWVGVGLTSNALVVEPNIGYVPVELLPTAERKVSVEASLKYGITSHLPTTTEDFYGDERSERPPSPLQPNAEQDRNLRLTYKVDFEESTKSALAAPADYDLSDGFTGGRIKVIHESGEVLYNGFPSVRDGFSFPKGSSTIVTEFSTIMSIDLDSLKTMPMRLAAPLESPQSLAIYAEERARFHGKPTKDLGLYANRQEVLLLHDNIAEAVAELKPMPDYLSGSLVFKDEDDLEIAKTGLIYMIGDAPSKVTDQEPESKPGDDLKTPTEKMEESVYALQLAYVQEHRLSVDAEIAPRRIELLDQLQSTRSEDPAPLIERAIEGAILAGLASEVWGKLPDEEEESAEEGETPDELAEVAEESELDKIPGFEKTIPGEEQILAWLDKAETLADAAGVSQFFGAKPVALPGDLESRDEIAAEEKEWSEKRDALATINRLRADIHRGAERMDDAWTSWAELKRWEAEPAKDSTKLAAELYAAADLQGLALESLNARVEDDPFDTDLLNERIALYRELGWEKHAIADERLLAVRAANLARLDSL